jgi:hypothetical protein
VQFGDDWPGTFIRGDNAFGYAMHLEIVLDASKADPISCAVLRGLLSDLRSSDARTPSTSVEALPAQAERASVGGQRGIEGVEGQP